MTNLIYDIPAVHDVKKGLYHMVVENPTGVMGKFEIDKTHFVIRLDRVSSAPIPFPFEYGFIPQTWNQEDDDPMDAMCWLSVPTFPGCLLNVRPIGILKLIDTGEIDSKVLCICPEDPVYSNITSLSEFPKLGKHEGGK